MSTAAAAQTLAHVLVQSEGRPPQVYELVAGGRLFAGSDDASDIQIDDADVSATHCAVLEENGAVVVRDCYSRSGTLVNGTRVRTKILTEDVRVDVGPARLLIRLTESASRPSPDRNPLIAAEPARQVDAEVPAEKAVDNSRRSSGPPQDEVRAVASEPRGDVPEQPRETLHDESRLPSHSDAEFNAVRLQLVEAKEEIEVLRRRLADAAVHGASDSADRDQAEMIELLKAEVIDLQAALAERDQTAGHSASVGIDDADSVSREEAERLVGRLEELLQELGQRDEQIAAMTELLRSAEEAERAHQEEQSRLDDWLSDIEARFGSTEQQWEAEREELIRVAREAEEARERAEHALQTDTGNASLEATRNVIEGLKGTAELQRQRIRESEEMIDDLKRQLADEKASQPRVNAAQLAEAQQETQALRAEVERLHREQASQSDDSNLKFRALRQHLNELHSADLQQKQDAERQAREDRRLSSRIARLWSRLEGR